ncbi:MAG: hypothetical protein IT457_15485 [Planctomycetes bacterium]|nr:hypothetical protein [Planctomycetota bacterium]
MKSHQLAAALAAILAVVQGQGLAQDNVQAAIVIRSDPSLMSLTPEALSALLSPQRLLVVADSGGTPLSAFVLRDDAPQPPGVFVGRLVVGGGKAEDGKSEERLDRVARLLEEQLRARLEAAPLRRLQARRDALHERLEGIAVRRRGAVTDAELAMQRERLDQDRARSAEELMRRELELASETTVYRRFEDEIAHLGELVKAGREPSSSLERVKTELAQVGARIQSALASVDEAKKRLADCDAHAQRLRAARDSAEDGDLLAAEFERVAQNLARIEEDIATFRPLEFEIWR